MLPLIGEEHFQTTAVRRIFVLEIGFVQKVEVHPERVRPPT
jgi:hypothetical protein